MSEHQFQPAPPQTSLPGDAAPSDRTNPRPETALETAQAKIPNPESKAPRVLVIDDEAHIVQVLSLKLRNAGYEVITAVDGEEGFEYATKRKPDLIITDFQMPYMTGLELCRALAGDPATMAIPVLMLTARGYALDPEDLALGNIRDVLSKPFSPRAIVDQIQRILAPASGSVGPSSVKPRSEVA